MKRASYDAAPIPSSLENEDYRAGTRDYTPIQEKFKEFKDVNQVVKFINSKKSKAKINTSAGLKNYCPTRKLKLSVDKEKAKLFVPESLHSEIVDEIKWQIKGNGIYKNKLMVLDILANFNWDRPIYFAITVGKDNFMGLEKYFQLEGLAYRLVPYLTKNTDGQTGAVASEIMYDNVINKFSWGGLNNKDIYFDETNTRMIMNYRNNYARLAEKLLQEQKNDEAIAVLDKCVFEFPREVVNLSYFAIPIIDLYYKLGENKKADNLLSLMLDDYLKEYNYLTNFSSGSGLKQNLNICGQVLGSLSRVIQIHQLENNDFEYFSDNEKYYKSKNGEDEEISYENYRINTFMDEFYSLQ
jgi:hypothetical protein